MKVGFYSPLPPARTGVADYAAALLAALRRRGTAEVAPARADVFLYHLGNNQVHREIYRRALERPGVIVLHDAVLQHFFLGSLSEQEYIEEFVYNYGEWQRDFAREMWRNRAGSGLSWRYYQYPMLKRIAEVSLAVVVHNPAAAQMVQDHAPRARVIEIPHLFAPPELPAPSEALRLRQRWGLGARSFVCGVFGYLRESKRLPAILRAFERVHRAWPDTALVIAGEFASSDAARGVAPLLSRPGIVRLGYLAAREFWLAASAVDACINLRYPAAGETSGITVRMMGIGKPVMVTMGQETSRYPETACFRIEPGVAEEAMLAEYSMVARSFPETSREIGRRAAAHVRVHHAPDRVADEYWKTLCMYAH